MGFVSEAFGTDQMRPLDAKSIIAEVKKSKAKLKVVNLWASWCAPCREELPVFAKLEKLEKDVEFFYVSGDEEKDLAEAIKAIKATGVNGTKFRLNPISEEAFKEFAPTWSGSLPATVFYYGQPNSDLIAKAFTEKQLRAEIKARLAKVQRNRLIDKTSSPKVTNSQGKKMTKHSEFESKKPNPDYGSVYDVVAEEVNKKRQDVQLIDVRQPDEYTGELSHIPGTTLIPLGTLPEKINELSKDKTIVFVCRSGARSAKAAAFAQSNGFEHVYNLKGGMIRWNELHLETESKKQ